MVSQQERKGIVSVGNWIVDSIKFIDVYPKKGNLTTIHSVDEGLGGCAHNVLVDLASLGTDLPLFTGGCIGDDDHGRMCLDACRKFGIDAANLEVMKGESTSYTDVMTENGGARTFFHCRGANAKLGVDKVLSTDTPARIFHLGYLLLLDELDKEDAEYGVAAARALHGLQQMGYKTSVDVVSEEGDRYRKVILPCLKYTDYLIINEVELGNCVGRDMRDTSGAVMLDEVRKAAGELLEAGVSEMVVIHYPEGGVVALKDGSMYDAPSFSPDRSEIVSTVGAGDAFCAGSLYAIHEGYDPVRLLRFASACARFNLFNNTSTGGAPTIREVEEFLKTR